MWFVVVCHPDPRQNTETVAIQEYQRLNVAQTSAAGMTRFKASSGASLEDAVSHLTYTNNYIIGVSFHARCNIVQTTVLRLHVIRPSVCPSVEILETSCTDN